MPIGNICNGISFRHDDSVLRSFSGAVISDNLIEKILIDSLTKVAEFYHSHPKEKQLKLINSFSFGLGLLGALGTRFVENTYLMQATLVSTLQHGGQLPGESGGLHPLPGRDAVLRPGDRVPVDPGEH